MSVRMAVGGDNFDELRQSGSYYVDKTELLYELVQLTNNKVTLFTRPRRFGKTLTMSMMESFFDIRRDSRAVFDGLDILKHKEFCAEWMNQYPVLFLSFKDVEGLTFEDAYGMLSAYLSGLCIKFSFLSESDSVSPADKLSFDRIMFRQAHADDIKYSLLTLTRMMNDHYGKPVILLIDEYDVPLAKANEEKEDGERYYPKMLNVIRGMLSTALKTNDYLKFAVVTGCLRISKESIFTGVNNFKTYSILDHRFSPYFGFTDGEVRDILSTAGLSQHLSLVRSWYDGYVFGKTKLFCPWDVVNFIADVLSDTDIEPKNYWKNTSGNRILMEFVGRTEYNVADQFETLMNGGQITQTISDELTYDSLHESEESLWSVLLMTGYLTKANAGERGNTLALRIPNVEISTIFEDTVVRLFRDTLDRGQQRQLINALWQGDAEKASELVSDFLWGTISYHDYHEDYYHAFLAGLFVGQGFGVKSNREQGLGRSDLVLTDRKNRRAIVIEAKKSKTEERMEQDCADALQQIVEKRYADGLKGYRTIQCYGVAFYQKSALVRKL